MYASLAPMSASIASFMPRSSHTIGRGRARPPPRLQRHEDVPRRTLPTPRARPGGAGRDVDRRAPTAARDAAAAAQPHERNPRLRPSPRLPARPSATRLQSRGATRSCSPARSRPARTSRRATAGPTRTRASCSSGESSTRRAGRLRRRARARAARSARARGHVARTGARRPGHARSGLEHQIGDGRQDVRGRYHPRWVGHRTLASTRADQRRFWTALAAGELCDLDRLTESVEIGFDAPGFVRPSYGLGRDDRPRLAGRPADRPRRRRPRLRRGHVRRASARATTRSSPSSSAATSGSMSRRQALDVLRELRYRRLNVLRTGALVRPEVSRTAIVTV